MDSNSNLNEQRSAMSTDVLESGVKWPTMKNIVDPEGPFIRKWNIIMIVSCVVSVLLDPLFLYIPIIKEDMKCLRMDENLKIAALVFRSLTDLCYILSIIFQVYRHAFCSDLGSGSCSSISSFRNILLNIAKIISHSYIIIDILAVLPLPQVAVLILLSKTRGSASWETLMNFLVLVQYMPRVLRIYLSCKESAMTSREETTIWIKGVLNLFLYILASHVLGAFWYFFAVQRITTCWENACRKENGCETSNFDCHDYHTLRNTTFLSDSCPIDPANAKLFDFGMFLDILQFGILGSTNYPEKFAKCFWWGLQNLSSLGSNLPLSIHTWENLFAAFVSIIGLLLFLYLIGNLQTYMQLDVARKENQRWKMRIKKKMDGMDGEIEKWVAENGLPSYKKSDIMAKVEVEFKENRDVKLEKIMSILPLDLQIYVKSCMPLTRLRKVPLLQNMDEAILMEISECLQPLKYKKDDIIIEEDKPLEMMIFIVDGLVSIEKRDASTTLQRGAEQLYGEQVLCWPAWTSSPGMSHESARAIGDVEVLFLMATDMERVGCKFRSEFTKKITLELDAKWELLDTDLVAMLRKVPKLETMDSAVLKAISQHLKPETYSQNRTSRMITKGQPVRCMMFVVAEGSVFINDYTELLPGVKVGQFAGEELLDWVLDSSFPELLPVAKHDYFMIPTEKYEFEWYNFDREPEPKYVEVLFLYAEDLASVVSEYRSHFSRVVTQTTDLVANVTFHRLKKVPMFQDMDEELLKEISKCMKHKRFATGTVINESDKPLDMMFLVLAGADVTVEGGFYYKEDLKVGDFYGFELAYWITHWGSHTDFPAKLPLAHSSAAVTKRYHSSSYIVEVAVLWADDLKRIVSEFRSKFFKQIAIPMDSEGKPATLDPLTMLKKVPTLANANEDALKAICSHLKPMKYSDDTPDGPYIYKNKTKYDKMFFITSGVVCHVTSGEKKHEPLYSGEYFGDLKWVLDALREIDPDSDEERWQMVCFKEERWQMPLNSYKGSYIWVGEVEVLVLTAEDFAKVASQFNITYIPIFTYPGYSPSDGFDFN